MKNAHGTNPMRQAQKSAVNHRFQVSEAEVGLLSTFDRLRSACDYAQGMADKNKFVVDVWDRNTKKIRKFYPTVVKV